MIDLKEVTTEEEKIQQDLLDRKDAASFAKLLFLEAYKRRGREVSEAVLVRAYQMYVRKHVKEHVAH